MWVYCHKFILTLTASRKSVVDNCKPTTPDINWFVLTVLKWGIYGVETILKPITLRESISVPNYHPRSLDNTRYRLTAFSIILRSIASRENIGMHNYHPSTLDSTWHMSTAFWNIQTMTEKILVKLITVR